MLRKAFLRDLILTGVVTLGGVWGASFFFKELAEHALFGFICVIFFVVFTLVAYLKGVKAVHSDNKNTFTAQVMALISIKMVLSVLVVIVYAKITTPETAHFTLYFFVPYILFSILEYYYLMEIAKEN